MRRNPRRSRLTLTVRRAAACLAAAALLAACGGGSTTGYNGGDDGDPGSGSAAGSHTINMVSGSGYSSGFQFSPQTDTVAVGDTVVWQDQSGTQHTVTSDSAGVFDSGTIAANGSYRRVFSTAGDYPYHCQFHGSAGSDMYGTLVVEQ